MKIGIVGLGLIGGSIFKNLNKKYEVVAVSKSQSGEKIFDNYDVLKDCDIVFVCAAMNKTLEILDKLEKVLPETTIVSDVCSLKEFVCQKKRPYKFIPSHPMAGTEKKGFENSFEDMFNGAKWVVIENEYKKETELLCKIIKELGAEPIFAKAEEHDKAAAKISHMPMVLAQALMLTIENDELAKKMASSGFRDMTRLAMSNEEMACDMVFMNHKNIEQAILKLYESLGKLTSEDYPKIIKELKEIRKNMY